MSARQLSKSRSRSPVRTTNGGSGLTAIHWFRKGLRLHDNPALIKACQHGTSGLYPLFIMDPKFQKEGLMSINRHDFLLESLHDLDNSLKGIGTRLFVANGKPEEVLPTLVQKWNASLVTWEGDTGPYGQGRDAAVLKKLDMLGCHYQVEMTHTLFPMTEWLDECTKAGGAPKSYGKFCDMFKVKGTPKEPIPAPTRADVRAPSIKTVPPEFALPTLNDSRYAKLGQPTATKFPGGETEGLARLQSTIVSQPAWTRSFAKPNTAPNSLEPSTTVLAPYITMGCLSVRSFWHAVDACKPTSQPPVSLHGQLLWREFFYLCSATTPNFDKMVGNKECKQIPWDRNTALVNAWKEARTGYPFIDAIMTQLRVEGWIHHLARHAVACFLTRGDLWQHWEEGAHHFEYTLLDGDWAINNANWQWLSCSRFFYQYGRCYSPIAFGKKTDPKGLYIKKWLPQLKKFPEKYIYEPWTAPLTVQKAAGCTIGKDYPRPIVDHAKASKANMDKLSVAYKSGNKKDTPPVGVGFLVEQTSPGTKAGPDPYKRRKRSRSPTK